MQDLLNLDKHQMQYKSWCATLEQEDLKGIVWDCFTPYSLELQHLGMHKTSFLLQYILLGQT